jgi:hypothetical protein
MRQEREAVADYVAAMSSELAEIARRHSLDSAAYLLEIAAAEAECSKANRSGSRRSAGTLSS